MFGDASTKNVMPCCQDCEKQYTEKGQLKRHIKNVHEGIKSKCDHYCQPKGVGL